MHGLFVVVSTIVLLLFPEELNGPEKPGQGSAMNSSYHAPKTLKERPRHVFDQPARYDGPDSLTRPFDAVDCIKIGVFLPDPIQSPMAAELIRGMELAIHTSPQVRGVPICMILLGAEGTWSDVSRAAIELAYGEEVWAIIGGIDSESAHLVEQVTLKARIPLLIPVSADASLNQVRVPWIFRMSPSFDEQARFLVSNLGTEPWVMVSGTNLDGRMFRKALHRAIQKASQMGPKPFLQAAFEFQVNESAGQTESTFMEPYRLIVLSGRDLISASLGRKKRLLLGWDPLMSPMNWVTEPGTHSAGTCGFFAMQRRPESFFHDFSEQYCKAFQKNPSEAAALGFDAMCMLIQVIDRRGLSRKAIREGIAAMDWTMRLNYSYSWDPGGGNASMSEFVWTRIDQNEMPSKHVLKKKVNPL